MHKCSALRLISVSFWRWMQRIYQFMCPTYQRWKWCLYIGIYCIGFNPHGGRGLIVLALFWDGNFSIKKGSWGNKFLSLWTFWKTKKNVFHSVFGWYRRCGCTFYNPHHGSHVQTQSSYIQKPLTSRVMGLIKFMPLLLNSQ